MSRREFWNRATDFWWVLVVPAVVLAFIWAAAAPNPAEEAGDHIIQPAAESLGISDDRCRGWDDVSAKASDTIVKSCQKDGWLVVLDKDNEFSHCFQLDTPGAAFKYDPRECPKWPSD